VLISGALQKSVRAPAMPGLGRRGCQVKVSL
jgi:hypothetical protein